MKLLSTYPKLISSIEKYVWARWYFVNSKVLSSTCVLRTLWECDHVFKLQLQFLLSASPLLKVTGFCHPRTLLDRKEAVMQVEHLITKAQ